MLFAEGNQSTTLALPPTPAHHRKDPASSSTSWPRPSVGAHTICSFGKGDPENQDAYVASSNATGSKCFVGVFDGHGEMGRHMSNFAKNALTKSLFGHKDLYADPKLALENAYKHTQNQIETNHRGTAAQSGTTAVSAYQHRDRLVVANVGDSRAVLGRCDTARRNVSAVDLSRDHKPSLQDERARIVAAGGTVEQMSFPVMHNGGIHWLRGGPERVMSRNGFGGLAMSRSLGDLSLRPFVSAQPELIDRKLDSRDKLLVLGSDGVWDHVTSQEAVDIASKHDNPESAAREIAGVARKRWQADTDGMMSDDITAVVVHLDGTTCRQSDPRADAGESRTESRPRSQAATQELKTSTSRSAAALPHFTSSSTPKNSNMGTLPGLTFSRSPGDFSDTGNRRTAAYSSAGTRRRQVETLRLDQTEPARQRPVSNVSRGGHRSRSDRPATEHQFQPREPSRLPPAGRKSGR
mmetsp:Transcript_17712/g.41070  ORF Transcript_17712/g.41070 Transcript_17712/m.41070 type:complete len:466 (-) Transcript_17712:46-1443(-)